MQSIRNGSAVFTKASWKKVKACGSLSWDMKSASMTANKLPGISETISVRRWHILHHFSDVREQNFNKETDWRFRLTYNFSGKKFEFPAGKCYLFVEKTKILRSAFFWATKRKICWVQTHRDQYARGVQNWRWIGKIYLWHQRVRSEIERIKNEIISQVVMRKYFLGIFSNKIGNAINKQMSKDD